MPNALEIKNLKKVYGNGVEALKGVNLTVAAGDFFALLGPNGAGKSTTINVICGLVNKTSGEVFIEGLSIDDDYQKAKEPIVTHQVPANFAIVNQDYPASKNLAQKTQGKVFFVSTKTVTNGVFLKNGSIDSNIGGQETICQVSDILIPGRHNLENVIAACAVAKINQVENENIVKVLSTFKGLPHRLQLVGEINGVQFYNDSYSTIPETAIAAIEAFSQPKVLILGGSSKKSDFAKLGQKIHDDGRIKAVVLIGREAARIKKAIEDAGPTGALLIEGAKNMHQIANLAFKEAKAGDVVILSPACASLDMFKNYHDRGIQFIEEVKSLK